MNATPATTTEAADKALALSVPDFARTLGVSKATVYRLMKDRKLKTITVAGRRLVPTSEAHRIVNEAAFVA